MKSFFRNSHSIILSVLLLFLAPLPLFAGQEEDRVVEISKRLQQHLDGLASLSFTFTQQTQGQMSERVRQASGEAFFIKDRNGAKMRWNYSAPDLQVIISDGITLKMYFEKLKQMIIAPAESLQEDVTYSFFTGKGKIEEDFLITDPGEEKDMGDVNADQGYQVIKLIPRAPTTQIKSILLWIDAVSQIRRIVIRDNFDTVTTLNLSNIEENSLIRDGKQIIENLFEFTPPQGTEIIQQ